MLNSRLTIMPWSWTYTGCSNQLLSSSSRLAGRWTTVFASLCGSFKFSFVYANYRCEKCHISLNLSVSTWLLLLKRLSLVFSLKKLFLLEKCFERKGKLRTSGYIIISHACLQGPCFPVCGRMRNKLKFSLPFYSRLNAGRGQKTLILKRHGHKYCKGMSSNSKIYAYVCYFIWISSSETYTHHYINLAIACISNSNIFFVMAIHASD